jgi:hypothetical protein
MLNMLVKDGSFGARDIGESWRKLPPAPSTLKPRHLHQLTLLPLSNGCLERQNRGHLIFASAPFLGLHDVLERLKHVV